MDLPDRPLLPHRTSGPTQPVKGLRTKGAGSHATLYDALRVQLHPPLGPILDAFDWMRRLRNSTGYPASGFSSTPRKEFRPTTSDEGDTRDLWAVVGSPAKEHLIRLSGQTSAQGAIDTIQQLNDAIEALDVWIETASPTIAPVVPVLAQAHLGDTRVTVLLDEDHDVVDLASVLEGDGPMFIKTGQSIADALQVEVQRQLVELRRLSAVQNAGTESAGIDPRLNWRVVRWMRDEASAAKFAAKLGKHVEIGSTITLVQGELHSGQ